MTVFRSHAGRFALVASLGLLAAATGWDRTHGQNLSSETGAPLARIVDTARLFDSDVVEGIRKNLRSEAGSVPVTIETVDSIGGRTIEEATSRQAQRSGGEGIFVLIAKEERKIDVQISSGFQKRVNETARKQIQNAFIDGLRKGPDDGLRDGIVAIQRVLARVKAESLPAPAVRNFGTGRSDSPLVVRNQARLTLGGARQIIEAAEAKAAEMNLKMNIAVVDDGGHLLAFARMDGARPASGYTAMTKATTAATFRQETGPLPKGATTPDPLLNLSLQNAALASGGKVTTLLGGVPVLVDGQVIGGVGVGGGTGEQDTVVAKAGIEAFSRRLQESETPKQR